MILDVTIHRLPKWLPMAGVTIGKHIWVAPGQEACIPHELVHVKQQLVQPVWFFFAYLFLLPILWNPWRVKWEVEAYAVDVANRRLTLDAAAKALSGPLYGWTCSYAKARAAIFAALLAAGRAERV